MRPTIAALVAVPLLVAGAVACGGSSDPGVAPSPSGGADGPTSDLAFTRCMRQHGIDMPDPNPDLWGLDAARTLELDQLPQWDAALEACADLLPPGALQDPGPSAQDLDQLLAFAACMRAHDIEISDPDPDGAMTLGGRLADLSRTQVETIPSTRPPTPPARTSLEIEPGQENEPRAVLRVPARAGDQRLRRHDRRQELHCPQLGAGKALRKRPRATPSSAWTSPGRR